MPRIIDDQEVKKFIPPSYQEMKNSEGKTPRDILIEEHKIVIGKRRMWLPSQCINQVQWRL
ncbi:unnamed protein product [Prunus armeniaca]|uniref:Uncharacterized protein n=1 Tax=Prunus armeniaca TaxID=36596 RepID=A0A6J5WAB7_PRUAR|nr:unnamed protein product [Prunus armeniaca]